MDIVEISSISYPCVSIPLLRPAAQIVNNKTEFTEFYQLSSLATFCLKSTII